MLSIRMSPEEEALLAQVEAVAARIAVVRAELRELEERRHQLWSRLRATFAIPVQEGTGAAHDRNVLVHQAMPQLRVFRKASPEEAPSVKETVSIAHELGELTSKILSKRLDITDDAATLRLGRAARLGLLERVSRGRYVAAGTKNRPKDQAASQRGVAQGTPEGAARREPEETG